MNTFALWNDLIFERQRETTRKECKLLNENSVYWEYSLNMEDVSCNKLT
jgi:hypothetical protein